MDRWLGTMCCLLLCLPAGSRASPRSQNKLQEGTKLRPKPTHFILAPSHIRPAEVVQLMVSIYETATPNVNVHAVIRRDEAEVVGVTENFKRWTTRALQMKVPEWASQGNYSLRVEGLTPEGGYLFVNESVLSFHPKHVSVFIQVSRSIFFKKQTVLFRVIALTQDLLPVMQGSIHIYVKDSRKRIVRRWVSKQLLHGLYVGKIPLGHPCKYGWWTILVEGFGHRYSKQFFTENCFRERIDMNLTMPMYVKEHEYALAGLLTANLTSGHPVKGQATVKLTVKTPGFKGSEYPTFKRTIPYFEGRTSFMFPMDEIRNVTSLPPGSKLKVTAQAEDFYYLGQLPATAEAVVYSNDVFLRFVGGSTRTFKPKVPFIVYVAVYESEGAPLSRLTNRVVYVHTTLSSQSGRTTAVPEKMLVVPDDGIVRYSFSPTSDVTNVKVRVSYRGVGMASQTSELFASRHYTRSGHYLSVTTSTQDIYADRYMVLTITCSTFIPTLHYLVMTGGRVLSTNTVYMTARQKTFALAVSRQMAPESRLVVYGILQDGEILTDSISVYVHGIRNDGVTVRLNKGKDFSMETVELTGLTDPGTLIAFAAQDYPFYTSGINHEEEARVFFTTYDVEQEWLTYSDHVNTSMAHTWLDTDGKRETVHFTAPSHAIDANTTFAFNGLTVFTDTFVGRIPNAWECNVTLGFLPCYGSACYRLDQGCDGIRQCEDGADEMGCPDPKVMEPKKAGGWKKLSRIWPHLDKASWAWKIHFTKPDGRIDIRTQMPVRPTTWVVGAFSLHPERGLAFNEHPARLDTTRPFYLVLESDKVANRGEQLGMRVATFNYHSEPLEALLTLKGSKDYRFVNVPESGYVRSYDPDTTAGNVQTMVYLRSGESKLMHFPILPTKTSGKIKVTIIGETPIRRAVVNKSIKITMDGVSTLYHTPYFINLVSQGSVLVPDMEVPVPEMFYHPEQREHLYVPGSAKCTVTLVGDIMGPGLTSSHLTLQKEAEVFMGNGEDYVFNLAYNMNWVRFLKITNQITQSRLEGVLEDMNKELMPIVAFILPSGGMGNRRKRSAESVWVTGFALETLAFAAEPEYEQVLYIDVDVLNMLTLWLISKQNTTTGAFHSESTFFDIKMTTNLTDDAGYPLYMKETAYAIIGLSAAQDKVTGEAQSVAEAGRMSGAAYLAEHFHRLTNPFDVCLVAMALNVANHRFKGRAFEVMRRMKREAEFVYWSPEEIPPDPTEIVNTVPFQKAKPMPRIAETSAVQATGYALILHLRNNRFAEAEPIMQWLQSQRRHYQFFGSGQDTIVAMQALREYGERLANRDLYNMRVRLEVTSTPNLKWEVQMKRGNFHHFNSFKVPIVYGSIKSAAVGTGLGLLQMRTAVNVEYPYQLRNPDERSYDLEVEKFFFYGRNASNFYMNVCFRWLRTDLAPHSGATILEVSVPSGFYVRKNVLRKQVKINKYLVKRARYTGHHVVYYMDRILPERMCESFWGERWWPVANGTIQHMIRIRDSSNPAFQNSSLYTTYDLFHLHICQVCGSFQCPYCPFYNHARPFHHTAPGRAMALLTCLTTLLLLDGAGHQP